jgi:membrane protein CcdC involved in cytochrome C biogenesis
MRPREHYESCNASPMSTGTFGFIGASFLVSPKNLRFEAFVTFLSIIILIRFDRFDLDRRNFYFLSAKPQKKEN